jgi:uncharacterized membrane protein YbhN (UPF0104 family)
MNALPERRSWRQAALRLGGSAVILALLVWWLPRAELWAAMRRVPAGVWLAALAGYFSAHIAGVLKWRLMVNLAGAGLGARTAARCYFAGLFGNIFLPSLIGGDAVRVALAWRAARSRAAVLLGSLADRLLDFVLLAGIAGAGALLLPGTLPEESRGVFRAVGGAFAAVAAIIVLAAALLPARKFSFRMRRRIAKVRRAWRTLRARPAMVLLAAGLGVVVQVSFIVMMWILAAACGLELPLRAWLFAYPLAKLAALAPVTQGGIGVREVALAALLAPLGAPVVLTVAAGLVWETVVISGGLLGGGVSMLLRK